MNKKFLNQSVTSEYVSAGHPDRMADEVADAILDALLAQDANTRAGIEVMLKDNICVLGGELNTTAQVNYEEIVRQVFADLHFPESHHLAPQDIKVLNLMGKQSEEIHKGVDHADGDVIDDDEIGAGDQGFMFGYASNETPTLMPLGMYLAKEICNWVATQPGLGPDSKSQVSVSYDAEGVATVDSILVSTMHQNSLDVLRQELTQAILTNAIGIDAQVFDTYIAHRTITDQPHATKADAGSNLIISINPAGSWQIGGPVSDCGVTGRKIVVSQFGGYAPVGGGAFSGKDMSKVDRSAAYMCRYLAKNIVAAGIANACTVSLAYQIGDPKPTAFNIELDVNQDKAPALKAWIEEHIDLTPKAIIRRLTCKSFYQAAVEGCYGHAGDATQYPWELVDIATELAAL